MTALKTITFDPSSPATPGPEILSANFDPAVHKQWRYRPAAVEILWPNIKVAAGGEAAADTEPVPLVTGAQAEALTSDLPNHLALAAAIDADELTKVHQVGKATSDAIKAWALDQTGFEHAKAELAPAAAVDREASSDGEGGGTEGGGE